MHLKMCFVFQIQLKYFLKKKFKNKNKKTFKIL